MEDYIEDLNHDCENRHKQGFVRWGSSDVEPGYHRTYCYAWYTEYRLCNNCESNLSWIKEYQDSGKEKADVLENKIDTIIEKLDLLIERVDILEKDFYHKSLE